MFAKRFLVPALLFSRDVCLLCERCVYALGVPPMLQLQSYGIKAYYLH